MLVQLAVEIPIRTATRKLPHSKSQSLREDKETSVAEHSPHAKASDRATRYAVRSRAGQAVDGDDAAAPEKATVASLVSARGNRNGKGKRKGKRKAAGPVNGDDTEVRSLTTNKSVRY